MKNPRQLPCDVETANLFKRGNKDGNEFGPSPRKFLARLVEKHFRGHTYQFDATWEDSVCLSVRVFGSFPAGQFRRQRSVFLTELRDLRRSLYHITAVFQRITWKKQKLEPESEKVELQFMVVPDQLAKLAIVPDPVRIKVIDPEAIFLTGLLGESGRKLVAAGVEFYFTRKLANKLIEKKIAIRT